LRGFLLPLPIQRLQVTSCAGSGRQRAAITRTEVHPRDLLEADIPIPGSRPPYRPFHRFTPRSVLARCDRSTPPSDSGPVPAARLPPATDDGSAIRVACY